MSEEGTDRLRLQAVLFNLATEESLARERRGRHGALDPPAQAETATGRSAGSLTEVFRRQVAALPTTELEALRVKLARSFLQELDLQLMMGRLYDRGRGAR